MHPPTASHIARSLPWVLVGALGMGGIFFIGMLLSRNLGSSAKGTFTQVGAGVDGDESRVALHNYERDASLVIFDDSKSMFRNVSGKPDGLARKIIYNSALELVVEDFAKAEQDMAQLIEAEKAKGGYPVGQEITGAPGNPRRGHWTVRVPVPGQQQFLDAVSKLGELQRTKTDSKDVTEESTMSKAGFPRCKPRWMPWRHSMPTL